jgi:hypothetical protein
VLAKQAATRKRRAPRSAKPRASLQLQAKKRQTSKLTEIRQALIAAGCRTTGQQALALGVKRSTAWALLNRAKRAGPSSVVLKRILLSTNLPLAVRRKVKEYIYEKSAGRYGHNERRVRWFRDQFRRRAGGEELMAVSAKANRSGQRQRLTSLTTAACAV